MRILFFFNMEGRCLKYFIIPTVIITAILTVVIFIVQFIIGIVFYAKCPIQPLVPIYDLVAGSIGIIIIGLSCLLIALMSSNVYSKKCSTWLLIFLLIVLILFELVWGIVGGVYTLPLRESNITQFEDLDLPTYCNPILYWMSFIILIIYFSALSMMGVNIYGVVASSK